MSLNITPNAALAIRRLLSDREGAGLEGAGLRIAPSPAADNGNQVEIKLAIAEQPHSTDEVIAQHGSKVFVEERLSPVLADKTLDTAEASDDNHVGFRLVS